MATNLDIDPKLIERARKIGRHRTKKEAVTEALEQYVQRRRQQGAIDLIGQVDFDPRWSPRRVRGKVA